MAVCACRERQGSSGGRYRERYRKENIFPDTAGLLIAWLPVLLSNDPGFYNYDIYGQVPQVMYPEVPYNTHHSLLSTLVMGGVITLGYRIFGTMEKAVFLHSCFQMILCAAAFSYSLDFWYRRLNRKWLLGVGFCFYAFLPTIALFSVSTTKDVVCSLALFIAFHLLYELYENTEGFFRKKENGGKSYTGNPFFLKMRFFLLFFFL